MQAAGSEPDDDLAAVRGCWEVAALGQFYRVLGPALELPDLPTIDEIEASLVSGGEEELLGLLPPLLNLDPATADVEECWREVAVRVESGDVLGFDEPPSSFSALPPTERGRLLHALAESSLSDLLRGPMLADPDEARGVAHHLLEVLVCA